jgi:hypothetical protein
MRIWFWLLPLLVLCLACAENGSSSDDDDAADDDTIDDDTTDDDAIDDDTLPPRSFSLAAAPMQYEMGTWSIDTVFDATGFAGLIDLLSMHSEFFGVPWDEFASGDPLPPAWVAAMEDSKAQIEALGVGTFLSVTALDGMRTTLIPKARDEGGKLVLEENWVGPCFDFDASPDAAKWRAAYQSYVHWMVDFFEPQYLNNLIEIDLYAMSCPDQYDSLIELANEVYDQEKAERPDLVIFPSFVMAEYWGYDEGAGCEPPDHTCFEAALARDANIKRDRYGVSSYPSYYIQEWGALPDDYYSALTDYTGERVVFAEIGVGSRTVVAPFPTAGDPCTTLLVETDATQAEFMQYLFEQANALGSDLLTWWSLRDFLPPDMPSTCPCDAPGLWCVLYDAVEDAGLLPLWLMWGSMGVLDYNGAAKPVMDVWQNWLARQVEDLF